MKRIAVFVDAGYLFAQGSVAINGEKLKRQQLNLDSQAVKALILRELQSVTTATLLRIYWYDGVSKDRALTNTQSELASLDDIKLRLGFINSVGEQKGVDSLIVTDLIELARNGSLCDALIISGDEDIRVGVQIAQSYGVRVHLVGLHPARSSQSPTLLWEADTTQEWMPEDIRTFLSIKPDAPGQEGLATLRPQVPASTQAKPSADGLEGIVESWLRDHVDASIERGVLEHIETRKNIPQHLDKYLLGAAKARYGILNEQDRSELRRIAISKLKQRAPSP
jgi:uncharacterized LabA/DUF88 family protein